MDEKSQATELPIKSQIKRLRTNIINILGKKIIADYRSKMKKTRSSYIYEINILSKIFNPIIRNDKYSKGLTLSINIQETEDGLILKMTPVYLILSRISHSDINGDGESTHYYDHNNGNVYDSECETYLSSISTKVVNDKQGWAVEQKSTTKILKKLIPKQSFIKWLRYNICNVCDSIYIKHFYYETQSFCYTCQIQNEMMKVYSDINVDKCPICLDKLELVGITTICGDYRHAIHLECFEKMTEPKCPICRKNIDSDSD